MSEILIMDKGDGASLKDSVYLELKNAILKGELEPHERLMEIPLANKLGVSRTPVREAIHRLAKEQLVIIEPHCGARVSGITGKDVQDALSVRIVIEDMAVRLAAKRCLPEHAEKLRRINDEMRSAVNAGKIEGTFEADNTLHHSICEITGNKVLLNVLRLLEVHVLRYRVEYLRSVSGYDTILAEHEAIIDALEAGDEEKASELITSHIKRQQQRICEDISPKSV